jgi:hypothetical protein
VNIGLGIDEMSSGKMGNNPKSSLINKFIQMNARSHLFGFDNQSSLLRY